MAVNNNIIALDIVLLPTSKIDEVYSKRINQKIVEQVPEGGFVFDDTHLPHITLLQLYALKSDLSEIEDRITELAKSTPAFDVELTRIDLGPLFGKELHLPSLVVNNTAAVQHLHTSVISTVKDKMLQTETGTLAEFYGQEQVNDASKAWVFNFLKNSSFDKYFPHITLGAATKAVVGDIMKEYHDSSKKMFPVQFKGTR